MFIVWLFQFLVLNCDLTIVQSITYDDMVELHANLSRGRNIDVRPVLDQADPVYVKLFFHLTYIQDFDEVNGKLSLRGYFGVVWKDQTAAWDARTTGISSLTYTDQLFWRPTLILANPYGEQKIIRNDDTTKKLHNDGSMEWYPADLYDVTCQADVTYYPFDTHLCSIGVVISGYTNNEIVLIPYGFSTEWFTPHQTWSLIGKQEERIDKSIQGMFFNILLKRKSTFDLLNFILPVVLMSFLNPLVFLVPASSGERVGYAVTVLLAMAVFLSISSTNLPSTSEPAVPFICIVLFIDVSFSAIIVVLVIISLRFHLCENEVAISKFWKAFARFFKYLRCGCCAKNKLQYCKKSSNGENVNVAEKNHKEKLNSGEVMYRGKNLFSKCSPGVQPEYDVTWKQVGQEVDFLFGSFSAVIMVAVHLVYVIHVANYINGYIPNSK